MRLVQGIYHASSLATLTLASYQWPSPQYEALEELLYEGTDKAGTDIASLATNCSSRLFQGGPAVGAEWLRLAYHDMSTHNVTDGTGGLDASIFYELGRPENVGAGNTLSVRDFQHSSNKYVSLADIVAMGAVWGVSACNGPLIPFRGGRIDAREAGRPGVPEPQQDLQSHTESFRLQGFTPEEMIRLVACGHTLGGVRALDFPTIVEDTDPKNDSIVRTFDSTQGYDNTVVAEYLNGTTKNPLIVNSNVTIQSDLRIFSSDGNVTMKSMESPSAFADTCTKFLERMINTVPAGVNLTEEVTLIPFKLSSAQITIIDSKLVLDVKVRVQTPYSAPPVAANRTVKLFWCDRRGESADCANDVVNFALPAEGPALVGDNSPLLSQLNAGLQKYEFRAPLSAGSVGNFWFTVGDGSDTPVLQDNGQKKYRFDQDGLIAVPLLDNLSTAPFKITYEIVVGLNTSSTPSFAKMHVYDNTIQGTAGGSVPIPAPRNFTTDLVLATKIPPAAGYTFYSSNFTDGGIDSQTDFIVEVDGRRYTLESSVIAGSVLSDNGTPSTNLSVIGQMSLAESMKGVNTSLSNTTSTVTIPQNTTFGA